MLYVLSKLLTAENLINYFQGRIQLPFLFYYKAYNLFYRNLCFVQNTFYYQEFFPQQNWKES